MYQFISHYIENVWFKGGINWECQSDSDCRSQIGLNCFNGTCSCPNGKYYDRIDLQCCTYNQ